MNRLMRVFAAKISGEKMELDPLEARLVMPESAAALRQLAEDIRNVARASSVFSMVHGIIGVVEDHLCARARVIELRKEREYEPMKSPPEERKHDG
jgi:hypothetical protein